MQGSKHPIRPTRLRVYRLAVEGVPTSKIAKLLGISQRRINRILSIGIQDRILSSEGPLTRGFGKLYARGPLWPKGLEHLATLGVPTSVPTPTAGGADQPPSPPETEVPAEPSLRLHNLRFKLPIFEDELQYRDRDSTSQTYGKMRRWTLGLWAGDYDDLRPPKGFEKRAHFTEGRYGAWEFYWLSKPRLITQRTRRGRGGPQRVIAGYAMLYPSPLTSEASALLTYPKEAAFSAVLDLLAEIARNRRLILKSLPLEVGEPEFGFPFKESLTEPIPKGKLSQEPLIWKDDSPVKIYDEALGRMVDGKPSPEIETRDVEAAKSIYLTMSLAKMVPRFPEEWAALKVEVSEIRGLLHDLLKRLGP